MRILFVNNKTYRGHIDSGWWYFYLPLCQLGHEVHFYDTVLAPEKDLNKVIESFKPDLIFCMLTGDGNIAAYEPWLALAAETQSGRTKHSIGFAMTHGGSQTSQVEFANTSQCAQLPSAHIFKNIKI